MATFSYNVLFSAPFSQALEAHSVEPLLNFINDNFVILLENPYRMTKELGMLNGFLIYPYVVETVETSNKIIFQYHDNPDVSLEKIKSGITEINRIVQEKHVFLNATVGSVQEIIENCGSHKSWGVLRKIVENNSFLKDPIMCSIFVLGKLHGNDVTPALVLYGDSYFQDLDVVNKLPSLKINSQIQKQTQPMSPPPGAPSLTGPNSPPPAPSLHGPKSPPPAPPLPGPPGPPAPSLPGPKSPPPPAPPLLGPGPPRPPGPPGPPGNKANHELVTAHYSTDDFQMVSGIMEFKKKASQDKKKTVTPSENYPQNLCIIQRGMAFDLCTLKQKDFFDKILDVLDRDIINEHIINLCKEILKINDRVLVHPEVTKKTKIILEQINHITQFKLSISKYVEKITETMREYETKVNNTNNLRDVVSLLYPIYLCVSGIYFVCEETVNKNKSEKKADNKTEDENPKTNLSSPNIYNCEIQTKHMLGYIFKHISNCQEVFRNVIIKTIFSLLDTDFPQKIGEKEKFFQYYIHKLYTILKSKQIYNIGFEPQYLVALKKLFESQTNQIREKYTGTNWWGYEKNNILSINEKKYLKEYQKQNIALEDSIVDLRKDVDLLIKSNPIQNIRVALISFLDLFKLRIDDVKTVLSWYCRKLTPILVPHSKLNPDPVMEELINLYISGSLKFYKETLPSHFY
jgi:hypothetical protein